MTLCSRVFPDFAQLLGDFATTHTRGQSLESLLITPIQRLPRYMLLLSELQKHSAPTHADYPALLQVCIRSEQHAPQQRALQICTRLLTKALSQALEKIGAVAAGVDSYMKARTAAQQLDPDTAIEEYSKSLMANPDDAKVRQ
jgi:hypothetical protein|eukprot:COSAG01_NODE_242_length_20582_cov_314.397256_11_plen_143_part_00